MEDDSITKTILDAKLIKASNFSDKGNVQSFENLIPIPHDILKY